MNTPLLYLHCDPTPQRGCIASYWFVTATPTSFQQHTLRIEEWDLYVLKEGGLGTVYDVVLDGITCSTIFESIDGTLTNDYFGE